MSEMNKKRGKRTPISFTQGAEPKELADVICDFVKKHKEKQGKCERTRAGKQAPVSLHPMVDYGTII